MNELNLIDDDEEEEEQKMNNAPIVINEVDIDSLTLPTEDEISRELGCDCRMNREITYGVKETVYKCLNCPDKMKYICLYCLENCHKSHINNLPSYIFRGDLMDFQKNPCECAKNRHKVTILQPKIINKEDRTNCPFDQLFSLLKHKYVYRRKENNKIFCLYCINNYSKESTDSVYENNKSSEKNSKYSSFGTLLRQSIESTERELRKLNAEKEDVLDDNRFYEKYDKVLVDYNQPYPSCECGDDLHKHQIPSENIENLCHYMTNIIERNRLNLDKLSYQIFNSDTFIDVFFKKLIQAHEYVYNSIKNIKEVNPSSFSNLADEKNFTEIMLDEKEDWEVYFKSTKLMEIAAKRLKIFNYFGINWMNEKYKKYFSFDTLNKLLQCKSNIPSNLFKLQLFTTKMYRLSQFKNIPHILLINENMSFINRQLFCSMSSNKAVLLYNEGIKIVDKIFYLLDFLIDNQSIKREDYNELFVEALKILKVIIPLKANDIKCVMNLFRKIENNISLIKAKKENQIKIIHSLEKIVEKIFSYINDNKFVFAIKEAEENSQYNFSFLSSIDYNKELLSTLFNFDEIEINESNPYINCINFYDTLLAANDNYSENIENFINIDKAWLKRTNKEYCYIFHGAAAIEEVEGIKSFFSGFTINIQNMLDNNICEFDFLSESNNLLLQLIHFLEEEQEINFKNQVKFIQNKYFINFIFFISLIQRISVFEQNTEMEGTEERNKIDNVVQEIDANIRKVLLLVTKDNPMTGTLLFSRIIITLLIKDNFDDLKIYIDVLKMMKKYNCKINLYFLVSHIHNIFKERLTLDKENIPNIINLLHLYKLILKISSDNSILKVNNIIGANLRYIIDSINFRNIFQNMENIDIIESVYKCIHSLQNEYFYIINQYMDMKSIIQKLQDDNLPPRIRIILTKIHTDYFEKNYFSTINIQKYFQNENLITSNLVENLTGSLTQADLQQYLNLNDKNSQIENTEDDKTSKLLNPIFSYLERYKLFHIKFKDYFEDNFKRNISFFTHIVLFPISYSVYKLTYFPKSLSADLRYYLYKLIFLFHYCFQYFIEEIVPQFDLTDENNAKLWSKLFVEDMDIDEVKKNLRESIEILSIKTGKNLDVQFLFNHFIKNSKCFIFLKENFFRKEEEDEKNDEEEEEKNERFAGTFYNLCLDMNMYKKIKKELKIYKELKADFEGNNVFEDIFQDENLEVVQKEIAIDLLYKLFFKKVKSAFINQEHIGYIFQSKLVKGPDMYQTQKKKSIFSSYYKGRRGAKFSLDPRFNEDKTEKYGDFYNPYLSTFLEEKSLYFEIIDKCFKVNPNLWQQTFVNMNINGRNLIYNIIMKQLPFLLQFIFIEFNKIDTKETKFYQYFVDILEFLRLLCEDHNQIFQTMLINYEKSIGKISLLANDKCLFIPLISKIPVFILLNLRHYNSKNYILKHFIPKDLEYFHPLIEKITDFLIEIIQGTYPQNFDDLTNSVDEISGYGLIETIEKHNRFLDYFDFDTSNSYESYMTYFLKFFNSLVEEGSNPIDIKVPLMSIFIPKQLLNISINYFKKCIHKYVGENITEGVSDKLIQVFIHDYDTAMNDTSFSLFLTLFLYIKKANSFQDKYQKILENLKEITNSDKVYEDNSQFLLMKEYYKFCSTVILETEIVYVKENLIDNKELYKYRYFFNNKFMNEVIEFRNKSFNKMDVEKVFFLVHPDSLYIKPFDIDLFLQKAVYDNFNTKLISLLDYYPELNQLIEMRKTLSKNMLALSQINYSTMEWISVSWAIVTNLFLTFGKNDSISYLFMSISSYSHIIFLSLLIISWYTFQFIKKTKAKDYEFSAIFFLKFLFYSCFNSEILPFIWSLFFGILASIDENTYFLYSLQLFPIFTLFEMMRSILDAVRERYKQFLSVAFLIIIGILFFSSVTYYFFNYTEDGGRLCTSYLNCFTYLLNSGLRSGGLPYGIKILDQNGFWGEFALNWMFYLLFSLLIMNIFGAIIVDKFDENRESNKKLNEEKQNMCYICSLHRSNFEIKGIKFTTHREQEHNIANYFHYLMKINRTNEHDLNSIDFQVYNAFKEKKLLFFPIKKAKSLENL